MTHYNGSVPEAHRKADWRDAGLCRSHDPELWFSGPSTETAKAICGGCPSRDACLQFALDEGIAFGVYGGLDEDERLSVRRATVRNKLTPEATRARADKAREPKKPRTLQTVFNDNTVRLVHGHLAWTGPAKTSFRGRDYTPKQIAFVVDRGYYPEGRVLGDCGISGCVLPAHIADDEERMQCGTRAGYQRHLKDGSKIDDACRQANADADNRLRRTGATKVSA